MLSYSHTSPANGEAQALSSNEPIRVLRVIGRVSVGGPAINACLLSTRLNEQRFQTLTVCGQPQYGERENTELVDRFGVRLCRIGSMRRSLGLGDLVAAVELGMIIAKFRPHIVHTHSAKAGALGRAVAIACSRRPRPRLVHTFHGHVLSGYFNSFTSKVFTNVERTLARVTNCIIAVSPQVAHELTEIYRVAPAQKVRVVRLGFDFRWTERLPQHRGWLRQELGVGASTKLIGIVARLVKVKNHALALRAFRRVASVDKDARLIVFGDGELRSNLQQLCHGYRIADRVIFRSWELDPARIYSDLNLTILSSFNEGTPVALIESLVSGVPVAATRVGGVEDVVRRVDFGALVESGDEEGLAAAILQRLTSSGPNLEIGTETRHRYSATRLLSDIEALYEELLSR